MKTARAPETLRVKMRGNRGEYEVGKEYILPVEKANELTGLGFAVVVEAAPPAEEET